MGLESGTLTSNLTFITFPSSVYLILPKIFGATCGFLFKTFQILDILNVYLNVFRYIAYVIHCLRLIKQPIVKQIMLLR